MRALIISGGGALGAQGGGVVEYLFKEEGMKYDIIIGTSTGALLSPMVALEKFDELKEAYTSMNQNDIFDINPFCKDGSISPQNAIQRIIRGKSTLGETQKLRKKIEYYLSESEYNQIKDSGIDVQCCVYNYELRQSEYKSVKDSNQQDYCDWMTASASVPIAMTTVKKNGYSYVDGGVSDHIPARSLFNYNITELDVIVHRTEDYVPTTAPKNILNHFMKVIDALQVEITKDDIDMIDNYCAINKVQTRIFYLPHKLTSNSLMFDKNTMLDQWNLGRNKKFNLKKIGYKK